MSRYKFPDRIPDLINPESEFIQFDLTKSIQKGKYSWQRMDKKPSKTLDRLKSKLEHYSQLTVHQFQHNTAVGFKPIKGDLNLTIPDDLSEEIGDNAQPCEFRIDKKFRIAGFLSDNVFYIVWLDPDHELTDKH